MKLIFNKKSPEEMTPEEFERYGEHLQRVQSDACYFGALGQPGGQSDKARFNAAAASKELSRIQYGKGHPSSRQP